MIVANYAPSIADMKAMLDGDHLVELPGPYGPYHARLAAGETWADITAGCPVWTKGGPWWRQERSGTVLSATELRVTRKHLYPMLSDNQLHEYLQSKETL